MSLLFDVSPDENTGGRKRARNGRRASVEKTEPEKPPSYIGQSPVRAVLPIGRADDLFDCACGARCHDILREEGHDWYVSCCFCGTSEWVDAVPGHLQPKEAEFVFRDGRFAGMTLPETAMQPRGMDYITLSAQHHKRPAVRDACKTYLDRLGAAR